MNIENKEVVLWSDESAANEKPKVTRKYIRWKQRITDSTKSLPSKCYDDEPSKEAIIEPKP